MALISCSAPGDFEGYKVGFSQPVTNDAWRQSMIREMERQLLFHEDIELIIKDAEAETSIQIRQIQELIEEDIDLLIISPNEAEPITPIIESVYDRGIPVIVMDRRIYTEKYTAFVGADNTQIGKDAGAYIGTLLENKGVVIELVENQSVTAFLERHQGFAEGIKSFSSIQVVPSEAKELQMLKEIFNTKRVDAVFAPTDVQAHLAYQLADSIGLAEDIDFVGIDGLSVENGGQDLVAKGILEASILYPTGGDVAIDLASSILKGEKITRENLLNSPVINANNVSLMQMQNGRLAEQQGSIEELGQKLTVINAVFKTQQNLTYLFAATLVVSLILGAFVYKSLVDKGRINRELEEKNKQITEYSKAAEDANQAKLKFFTNISHEFKTPLTLINGPVEDLLANPSAKAHHHSLSMVHRNTGRLLSLVNELMDLRKIDLEKMKVSAQQVDLVVFLKDMKKSFDRFAEENKIDFKISSQTKELMLWIDQSMMDKVFFNLLSNAFKFTESYGKIHIQLNKDEKVVEISIIDNGAGMTQEQTSKVFDRFYQGDQHRSLGTGIGLSLVNELVQLHYGEIKVESDLGKGSKFTIVLPIGREHLSEDEIASSTLANFIQQEPIISYEFHKEHDTVRINENESENSVLLIDDNDELRKYLQIGFSETYNVISASNIEDGIDRAYKDVPDLIICDLMLGDRSGFEVIEKLKEDVRTSHIPIMILTAKGNMEDKLKGIRLGADDYITKPFSFMLLQERVNTLLINRRKIREHYVHELPREEKSSGAKVDRKFVNEFQSLVEQNLSIPNYGVQELCDEMGLSRVQLYRKVKAILGYSVIDYINAVRIKKAKHLINEGDMNITEIAYAVGYSTPAYFSTAFKHQTGKTPSEFKQG